MFGLAHPSAPASSRGSKNTAPATAPYPSAGSVIGTTSGMNPCGCSRNRERSNQPSWASIHGEPSSSLAGGDADAAGFFAAGSCAGGTAIAS